MILATTRTGHHGMGGRVCQHLDLPYYDQMTSALSN